MTVCTGVGKQLHAPSSVRALGFEPWNASKQTYTEIWVNACGNSTGFTQVPGFNASSSTEHQPAAGCFMMVLLFVTGLVFQVLGVVSLTRLICNLPFIGGCSALAPKIEAVPRVPRQTAHRGNAFRQPGQQEICNTTSACALTVYRHTSLHTFIP